MDRTGYAENFVDHCDGETPETLRWLPGMYWAAAARLVLAAGGPVQEVLAHHYTSHRTGLEGAAPGRPAFRRWRAAGVDRGMAGRRVVVHPDNDLIPWPDEADGEGGDEMPADLPG